MNHGNLFQNLPADLRAEVFEVLAQSEAVTIERIVSKGQASPDTGWYDQERNEWVIVLQGRAKLEIEAAGPAGAADPEAGEVAGPAASGATGPEASGVGERGETGVIELGPGDYVNISAHVKHRVLETSMEPVTIWLAVHY